MRTFSDLEDFPEESSIVGRLVLAYGELEWTLCLCLSAVLDDETGDERINRAGRAIYRTRGEEFRITLADALMRDKFKKAKLEPPYSEFIGDLTYCKTIRNQYAHCHWIKTDDGKLAFFSFEEGAKKGQEFSMHTHTTDIKLLNEQSKFFNFVWVGLMLLYRHYEHSCGRMEKSLHEFPKKIDRPALFVERR